MSSQHSKTTLFIRNIPLDTTKEELESFFSDIGPIKSCFLVLEDKKDGVEERKHRGIGFVQYSLASDCQKALDEIPSVKFKGVRNLKIELAVKKRIVKENPEQSKHQYTPQEFQVKVARLIVRNLPFKCTEEDLKSVCLKFGVIKTIQVPHKQDGKARGFGFVEYETVQEAQKAIEKLNGSEILGRSVAIDWSVPKTPYKNMVKKEKKKMEETDKMQANEQEIVIEELTSISDENNQDSDTEDEAEYSEPANLTQVRVSKDLASSADDNCTLFIRNLAFDTQESELNEKYARVTMDRETGMSKGTAFVCFMSRGSALECLEEYEHTLSVGGASFQGTKSLLVPEPSASSGKSDFVLNGRFLNLSMAVNREKAEKLTQENTVQRKQLDKRNLYLIKEGVIFPDSDAAKQMKPAEVSRRHQSYTMRKKLLDRNPNLFISKTRLSVRNMAPSVDEKMLRKACIDAVKQFWSQVDLTERSSLEDDVIQEELKAGRKAPCKARQVKLTQVKIMRDKERIEVDTKKGKSKGFGFIEFESHADALACLRCLNNNPTALEGHQKNGMRLIVEFSVENNLVIKKRRERMLKKTPLTAPNDKSSSNNRKSPKQMNANGLKMTTKAAQEKPAALSNTKLSSKKTVEAKVSKVNNKSDSSTRTAPKNSGIGEPMVKRKRDQTSLPDGKKSRLDKEPLRSTKAKPNDSFDALVSSYKSDIFKLSNEQSLKSQVKRWFA